MTELGDLGLSPEDEAAIVAFLKALSDGYTPPAFHSQLGPAEQAYVPEAP